MSEDEQAIARYRYLLRTAPPETIEQAHAEAFARLTPEQRRRVLEDLAGSLPDAERAAVLRRGDEPGALAQAATRAEIRAPGTLERTFGGGGMRGMSFGGLLAGSLFASLAGTVLGTMVAQSFMHHAMPSLADLGGDPAPQDGAGFESSDAAADDGGGFVEAADDPGADFGGDFGGDTFDV